MDGMIELCDDCDYTVFIADIIATLMTYEKHKIKFKVQIWVNNWEIPFTFEYRDYFNFLQEGLRIEDSTTIHYFWYDMMNYIRIEKL